MVLGATPEFRDLLADLGFENIIVLEKNLSFKRLLDEERAFKNAERTIEGDWLTSLHAEEWQLAFLLSDLTLGNIAYERRTRFFDGI